MTKGKSARVGMKPCRWPSCDEISNISIALPELVTDEDGNIISKNLDGMPVPFCMYHGIIAGSGHFGVIRLEGNKLQLHGQFPLVELIEAVMGAREATKVTQPKSLEEFKHLKKKVKEGISRAKQTPKK